MHKCKGCKGTGKIACPACEGSGREFSICPTCTKGYVPDPRAFDDEPTLKCPDCHGEYKKDVGVCKTCNGTGHSACTVCGGAGELDMEALCKRLINIPKKEVSLDQMNEDMVPIIKDAADNGVGIAATVMALLPLTMWNCDVDELADIESNDEFDQKYLQNAAEAGEPLAQFLYGEYLCRKDGKGSPETGFPFLVKAGNNGNIFALDMMASAYIEGNFEQEINLEKALACLKSIVDKKDDIDVKDNKVYIGIIEHAQVYAKYLPEIINNDAKAMLALSECIAKWMAKDYDRGNWRNYWAILGSKKLQEDLYWMEEAAKAGGIAPVKIADEFWKRATKDGADKDYKGYKRYANEWYKKAADEGDAIAQSVFGRNLKSGDGIATDHKTALIYLYKAAEQERSFAIRCLALLYRDGDYVEKSRSKANELFARAAKLGDGWSLYEIGKCYLTGTEVKKDESEAKRLLKLAAEKGVTKAKTLLSKIPDSVKDKNKGPSGIIVGNPDNSPLPKFLTKDYEQAVAGKSAIPAKEKKVKSQGTSTKKRWKFVVLGLLFGFLGLHLAYAKRWFLFLLLWAGLITGNVMSGGMSESETVQNPPNATQTAQSNNAAKGGGSIAGNIGFGVWALLWIGGTLFIKKDGKGNRM